MAFCVNGPIKPVKTSSSSLPPRYSARAFDTTSSVSSSYASYSDSVLAPHAYDAILATSPKRSAFHLPDSLSTAVTSSSSSSYTRAPLARASMLARTTSIRFGGLLNRTPTQKPRPDDDDMLEASDDMPEYKPTLTATPERTSRSATPRTSTPLRNQNRQSRFMWLGQQLSDTFTPTSKQTDAADAEDPLLHLNVNATLFPTGNTDPLNPDAFNDLLMTSTALVNRFQSAYRQKTTLIHQANAERDATSEESSEASTRAEHLKAQLQVMAARAAEQERAMQALADQLSRERQAQQEATEELAALRKFKALVEARTDSLVGEDLLAQRTPRPHARRTSPRVSDGDSGFESDADSATHSLDSASTASGPVTPGNSVGQPFEWEAVKRNTAEVARKGQSGPWGLVGQLQTENARLKTRVGELETAVEGVLGLVGS